ncbi:MAG: cysteine--tRNA ligase [Caldilineaceae bacterium]
MKLYNSYAQQLEDFRPQVVGAPVSLYVCGITPYDTTHLGHAFTYVTADLLIRYLAYQGQQVQYVQNVTDIDDDILEKASAEHEDWRQLGNQWTGHFIRDMQALNVRAPDRFPRATETIPQIIETVQWLVQIGVAYVAAGNVYFHIDAWPDFGRLSRLPRAEMLPVANERGNHPDDPHKRDPLDFVLWQAQKPGEPGWNSPWGVGRPGWHIECSTMATHLLGETIDIHMGGSDLLFPHHECEIAQVTPITGKRFARYWMHVAMVRKDGEKMSKSLGNLVMVSDLLKRYSANTLRLYLARHHYRHSWSYAEHELQEAEAVATKVAEAAGTASDGTEGSALDAKSAEHDFTEAMDADLDTAHALVAIEKLAAQILQAQQLGQAVGQAQQRLRTLCEVLGLYFEDDPPAAASWVDHLQRFAVAT